MLMLPGKEHRMGLVEIEVIKETKTLIERCTWNRHIRGKQRNQKCSQAYRANKIARPIGRSRPVVIMFGKPQYCALLPP